MWLTAVGTGLFVVVVLWIALFLAAGRLPPGRTKELVAFAPNCVRLIRRLRRDRRLPLRGRLALAAALLYLLSPVQVIPNFIPVIGQADDALVLMAALRYACRHLPRDAVESAWPGDARYLERLLGTPVPLDGDGDSDDERIDAGEHQGSS